MNPKMLGWPNGISGDTKFRNYALAWKTKLVGESGMDIYCSRGASLARDSYDPAHPWLSEKEQKRYDRLSVDDQAKFQIMWERMDRLYNGYKAFLPQEGVVGTVVGELPPDPWGRVFTAEVPPKWEDPLPASTVGETLPKSLE